MHGLLDNAPSRTTFQSAANLVYMMSMVFSTDSTTGLLFTESSSTAVFHWSSSDDGPSEAGPSTADREGSSGSREEVGAASSAPSWLPSKASAESEAGGRKAMLAEAPPLPPPPPAMEAEGA